MPPKRRSRRGTPRRSARKSPRLKQQPKKSQKKQTPTGYRQSCAKKPCPIGEQCNPVTKECCKRGDTTPGCAAAVSGQYSINKQKAPPKAAPKAKKTPPAQLPPDDGMLPDGHPRLWQMVPTAQYAPDIEKGPGGAFVRKSSGRQISKQTPSGNRAGVKFGANVLPASTVTFEDARKYARGLDPRHNKTMKGLLRASEIAAPYGCDRNQRGPPQLGGEGSVLMRHQLVAQYMAHPSTRVSRFGLFHEAGTGKTRSIVAIMENFWDVGQFNEAKQVYEGGMPILLFCKNSVQAENLLSGILEFDNKFSRFLKYVLKPDGSFRYATGKWPTSAEQVLDIPKTDNHEFVPENVMPGSADYAAMLKRSTSLRAAAEELMRWSHPARWAKKLLYLQKQGLAPKSLFKVVDRYYVDPAKLTLLQNHILQARQRGLSYSGYDGCVTIVDEAHNLWAAPDTYIAASQYNGLLKTRQMIQDARNACVVLATATPCAVAAAPKFKVGVPGDWATTALRAFELTFETLYNIPKHEPTWACHSWYTAQPPEQYATFQSGLKAKLTNSATSNRDIADVMVLKCPMRGLGLELYMHKRCGGALGVAEFVKRLDKQSNPKGPKTAKVPDGDLSAKCIEGWDNGNGTLKKCTVTDMKKILRDKQCPVATGSKKPALEKEIQGYATSSDWCPGAAASIPAFASKKDKAKGGSWSSDKCQQYKQGDGAKEAKERKRMGKYEYGRFGNNHSHVKQGSENEWLAKIFAIVHYIEDRAKAGAGKTMIQVQPGAAHNFELMREYLSKANVGKVTALSGTPKPTKAGVKQHGAAIKAFNAAANGIILLDASFFTESISLRDVRTVILADVAKDEGQASWALVRQRIARAVRMCSHSKIPAEQRNVEVLLALSMVPTNYCNVSRPEDHCVFGTPGTRAQCVPLDDPSKGAKDEGRCHYDQDGSQWPADTFKTLDEVKFLELMDDRKELVQLEAFLRETAIDGPIADGSIGSVYSDIEPQKERVSRWDTPAAAAKRQDAKSLAGKMLAEAKSKAQSAANYAVESLGSMFGSMGLSDSGAG